MKNLINCAPMVAKKLFYLSVMCFAVLVMNAQTYAVLDFHGSPSVSDVDKDGVMDAFTTYFHPYGYTMIDRKRVDQTMTEQRIPRTNITETQSVQVGNAIDATIVLTGNIGVLGAEMYLKVRAIDVHSGKVIALEVVTFSDDYCVKTRELAVKIASQITANSEGSTLLTSQRTKVEYVSDRLKVFPYDLGTYEEEPTFAIASINKKAKYGFNDWRLPTNKELSLLCANGFLGDGQYMTQEHRKGTVLLVSDKEHDQFPSPVDGQGTQAQPQAQTQAQAQVQSQTAPEPAAQRHGPQEHNVSKSSQQETINQFDSEKPQKDYNNQEWVDLGLPSGTLWKNKNEECGLITFDKAVATYGDMLPTRKQLEELNSKCQFTWVGKAYKVTGPNGNYIIIPAEGGGYCDGSVEYVGGMTNIWSSTPYDLRIAWYLNISATKAESNMGTTYRCYLHSVRLVR